MVDGVDPRTVGGVPVLAVVLMMLLILRVAAAVVVYVAFPHRGEEMPVAPSLGDAMRKGVDALPTLASEDGELAEWKLTARTRS